ncbi:MAG: chemotaxis response regulator protein-glutamate methylesterase [Terriglobia bacterium]
MVVDDSAVVRNVVSTVLSQEQDIHVTVAADPLIAMDKMKRIRPDVILLDLEMPRMSGIKFLRKIMAEDPIPVVICSALTLPGSSVALAAMDEGAVDVITKPTVGVRDFLYESSILLVDAVHSAAQARVRPRAPSTLPILPSEPQDAILFRPAPPLPSSRKGRVVVVGASTGGTESMYEFLKFMPPHAPGIVAVLHMPEVFTAAFAKRLDSLCQIAVKEAADGDIVVNGQALIAPGNRHTRLRRRGGDYVVEVVDGPLVSRHRPSVDVLFQTTAEAAGPNAIGVIMTGMGDDGARGMLEMKKAGAWNIAQDEASCVVFGMPKEAISRGGVDRICPLQFLAQAVLENAQLAGPAVTMNSR